MKILLVAINAKYIHSNLAVYSLRAYAKEHLCEENIELEIAEYTINQQQDDILRDVYEHNADMVCFSCYIWNLSYVEMLAGELGKICPQTTLWLGGPEVSYDAPDVLLRLQTVKGVMKGEGECTFAELCRCYAKVSDLCLQSECEIDKRLCDIAGITFRECDGTIQENPWREPMSLSEVPFVYDDMKDFEHKIIYYETSRGCPFSCSYCLSSIDKRLRFRDIDLVKKELKYFLDQKVPQVKFVDRTFNCKHEHAMAIWTYIAENDNGVTNFHFEISADLLNEEELNLLETMRPGLVQLEIGVQSTNDKTIREIRRTMDFERLSRIVKRIEGMKNIHQHLDLIAGLPFEDIKSFAASFDDVYALKPHQLQLGFLKVLKGSYMEEKHEDYGLVYKSTPPYEVLFTKWLPYADVLKLKGVEEMVEVYYNSRQFEHTLNELEKEYPSAYLMYEKLWNYYKTQGLHDIQHKRSARYEILLDFVREDERLGKRADYYRELLIYDYYLRENAKTRPAFAEENPLGKEETRRFYEEEAKEYTYLKGYEGYDKNQLRKMTHLERFLCLNKTVLFDYMHRNPVDQEAKSYNVDTFFIAKQR